MADRSLILFHKPGFGLHEARSVLEASNLTVSGEHDELAVRWRDGPVLRVRLARGPGVQAAIKAIASGTPYTSAMQDFDAWFEIAFDDPGAVLDEINTLIEAQGTLQNATRGCLFNTWNEQLLPPAA